MATYEKTYAHATGKHIEIVPFDGVKHVVTVQVTDRRGAKGIKLDRQRMDHLIAELQEARREMGERE